MRPFPSGQPQFRTVRGEVQRAVLGPLLDLLAARNRLATMSVSAAAARTAGSALGRFSMQPGQERFDRRPLGMACR